MIFFFEVLIYRSKVQLLSSAKTEQLHQLHCPLRYESHRMVIGSLRSVRGSVTVDTRLIFVEIERN